MFINCKANITDDSLKDYLESVAGKKVLLTLTDNSASLLSVKTKGNVIHVRLQRIFLEAGRDVWNEIAGFVKNKKGSMPLFRKFAKQNLSSLKKDFKNRVTIKTQGRYHDLTDIYEAVNNKYFNQEISSPITWGMKRSRCYKRKRTLGSYSRHTNTIRISPLLDKKTVPKYFIAFIVYHEMLHADMGVTEKNGRRSFHSREFRKREKLFEDYDKAILWEKRYI
jgi:hypothetical protein